MSDEHDVETIFDGGGFKPPVVADDKAAWEAHVRSESAPPEPVERVVEQPKSEFVEADLAALRADGWTDTDIRALTPEAAARHALRVSGRAANPAKAERAEEPSGPNDLEALLTEEFSSKTAKKLAPVLQRLTERQAALERSARESSLAGIRDAHVGSYPELARPEVERAVLSIAGPAPTKEQYGRALRVLYGTRQAADERAEAREQVSGQMTGGRRGPAPSRDPEAADRAAWAEYQKNGGDVSRAIQVRQRLGG